MMQSLFYFFVLPLLMNPHGDDRHLSGSKSNGERSNEVSYYLKMNGQKKLTRHANRYDQLEFSTFVENIVISDQDVEEVVQLINQKDRFRSALNDHFSPGVSSNGEKFNKRPQSLMNNIDPNTPIHEHINMDNAEAGTKGYSTVAFADFDGLQVGDTLIAYYNSGPNSDKQYSFIVIKPQDINSYGKTSIELPLGSDASSSEYFGLKVVFGKQYAFTRFEKGNVSYDIQIRRSLTLPEGTTAKPISKSRVKRRR